MELKSCSVKPVVTLLLHLRHIVLSSLEHTIRENTLKILCSSFLCLFKAFPNHKDVVFFIRDFSDYISEYDGEVSELVTMCSNGT